jgi:hypothetical protein
VTSLALGGGLLATGEQTDWTLEGANETIWNARGRRHRFKALAWARGDGLRQDLVSNPFGQYSFASLEDFAAGRAAGYTRTLAQPRREGTAWNAAAAVAHQWTPSRWFSALYGARLEGSAFGGRAPGNPALEQALGVRTGAAPARLHLSPRAGFSFTYNRDRENGSGTNQTDVGRFYRTTAGVIRGGIGEFRDLLRPGILADASPARDSTGARRCCRAWARPCRSPTGRASPPTRARSPPAAPAGGERPRGAGAGRHAHQPVVRRAPQLARLARLEHERGQVAAPRGHARLLRPQPAGRGGRQLRRRAALRAGRRGRPPGVRVAGRGGRRERDRRPRRGAPEPGVRARGGARQRPARLRRAGHRLALARRVQAAHARLALRVGAYTLQATRRQYRGFDGAAFGDPRAREWAPGPNDARHVVLVQGGFSTQKAGTVTLFARAQSGLPFTPLVQGDVNGDGRGFDRAYVPDPAAADPALGDQLRGLLAGGAPSARRCVEASLGGRRRATGAARRGPRRSTCSGARPSRASGRGGSPRGCTSRTCSAGSTSS